MTRYLSADLLGRKNGIATLDPKGKIPRAQLPDDVPALDPKGRIPRKQISRQDLNALISQSIADGTLPIADLVAAALPTIQAAITDGSLPIVLNGRQLEIASDGTVSAPEVEE